jgi:hypothetical protein
MADNGVPTVLKSRSLDPLEPSGPVQARNGTALPLKHQSGYTVTGLRVETGFF